MKQTHLVPRKSGNTYLFHFRNRIPKDLVQYFGGRRQFQISLKDVSSKETLLVSITLKQILKEIFQEDQRILFSRIFDYSLVLQMLY